MLGTILLLVQEAVVTKDVPKGVVVAGNPAKFISTVEDYMLKCKDRNVLYDLSDVVKKALAQEKKQQKKKKAMN